MKPRFTVTLLIQTPNYILANIILWSDVFGKPGDRIDGVPLHFDLFLAEKSMLPYKPVNQKSYFMKYELNVLSVLTRLCGVVLSHFQGVATKSKER